MPTFKTKMPGQRRIYRDSNTLKRHDAFQYYSESKKRLDRFRCMISQDEDDDGDVNTNVERKTRLSTEVDPIHAMLRFMMKEATASAVKT